MSNVSNTTNVLTNIRRNNRSTSQRGFAQNVLDVINGESNFDLSIDERQQIRGAFSGTFGTTFGQVYGRVRRIDAKLKAETEQREGTLASA